MTWTYLAVIIGTITVVFHGTTENDCFEIPPSLASIFSRVPASCCSDVTWSACLTFGKESHKGMANLVEKSVGEQEDERSKAFVFVVAWVIGLVCSGRCRDHIANPLSHD